MQVGLVSSGAATDLITVGVDVLAQQMGVNTWLSAVDLSVEAEAWLTSGLIVLGGAKI